MYLNFHTSLISSSGEMPSLEIVHFVGCSVGKGRSYNEVVKRENIRKPSPLTFVVDENSTGLSALTSSFPTGSSVTSVKALGLKGKSDPEIVAEVSKRGSLWVLVTADKKKDIKIAANTAGVTIITFSDNNSGTEVQGQQLEKLWLTSGFRVQGRITADYTEINLSKSGAAYQKRSGKQGVRKLREVFKHRI